MKEFLGFFGGAALLILALIAGIFGMIFGVQYWVERPACAEFGALAGAQTYYSAGTNCLVKRDGQWVDYKVFVGNKHEITVKQK